LISAFILGSFSTADALKEEEKENVRKQISTVKTWQMTEELDLSEEQATVLFPAQKSFEDRKTELSEQRQAIEAELDELLEAKDQNREGIKEKMASLKEIDEKSRANEDQFRSKLSEILTVEQQAKYELFEKKFDARLREMIRDIQKEDLQRKERSESDRVEPARQRRESDRSEQTDRRRKEEIEQRQSEKRETAKNRESSESRDSSRSRSSEKEETSEKKSSRKTETSQKRSTRDSGSSNQNESSKERSSRNRNR
jgi:hypothetical protein